MFQKLVELGIYGLNLTCLALNPIAGFCGSSVGPLDSNASRVGCSRQTTLKMW